MHAFLISLWHLTEEHLIRELFNQRRDFSWDPCGKVRITSVSLKNYAPNLNHMQPYKVTNSNVSKGHNSLNI